MFSLILSLQLLRLFHYLKASKYNAMDIFYFEHSMRDCVTLAELAVPVLATTFGPSADEESKMQVEVDPTTPLTMGDIQPVWKALNSLR